MTSQFHWIFLSWIWKVLKRQLDYVIGKVRDVTYAFCVCVAAMKFQNVAGLLTVCIMAVCSHPQPPQAPLNISKQEPGTMELFTGASVIT